MTEVGSFNLAALRETLIPRETPTMFDSGSSCDYNRVDELSLT
jgi:hypothetical protein